jgi:hypothetical protein
MKLVTRAALGWGASPASPQLTTQGTKVHYLGEAVNTNIVQDHSRCLDLWRNIRDSHLANTSEGYVDVAYNFAACPHGYLLEGRGLRKETAANGNQTLNHAHYAIVGLIGDSGLTNPTDDMLHAIRDGIDLLRQNGAGTDIKGHRDGYATSCPGGPLYAWVQAGAPRPGTAPSQPVPGPPAPVGAPRFPGRVMRVASPMMHGDDVGDVQRQLIHRGWRVPGGADGWYGPGTAGVVKAFQQDSTAHGWPLDDDAEVGEHTWTALFVRPVS